MYLIMNDYSQFNFDTKLSYYYLLSCHLSYIHCYRQEEIA